MTSFLIYLKGSYEKKMLEAVEINLSNEFFSCYRQKGNKIFSEWGEGVKERHSIDTGPE